MSNSSLKLKKLQSRNINKNWQDLSFFNRYLLKTLRIDLKDKILIITGPRQSGKTTLAKNLFNQFDYLNYDNREDHKIILEKSWDRKKKYIIFDEIHKKLKWKAWIKGVYDTEGLLPGIVVTGSARMNTYKKMGDSLAGRFFHYRLHPFDIKEIVKSQKITNKEAYERLIRYGGFPEPFLRGTKVFYGKWKKSHLDTILKEDIMSFLNIKSIHSMETLIQLLKGCVGSPSSYRSLQEDLDCSEKTIKSWITILENFYVLFTVTPWHKNISRSVKKQPKFYFYDIAQINNPAAQLENLVACALLKELHFREDVKGETWGLFYLKTKDRVEVDFLITKDNKPYYLIEVKSSLDQVAKGLSYFANKFKQINKVQLVLNLKKEKTFQNGIEIRKLIPWITKMDF